MTQQQTKMISMTILVEKVVVEKSMGLKEVLVRSTFAAYKILLQVHKTKENAILKIY